MKKTWIILAVSVLLAFAVGALSVFLFLGYKPKVEFSRSGDIYDGQGAGKVAEEVQTIGGQTDEHGCLMPAGYMWCPSTGKCQRMWEEYCEEYKEQYKGDGDELSQPKAEFVPGDAGENPPAETESWAEFESVAEDFKFKYPDNYKTVVDNYGWPHAVVHLINKNGGQSYDVTFEVWNGQDDAENEGRNSNPFFGMLEHPVTGKYISMTCWNKDIADDCEKIYATLTTQ